MYFNSSVSIVVMVAVLQLRSLHALLTFLFRFDRFQNHFLHFLLLDRGDSGFFHWFLDLVHYRGHFGGGFIPGKVY